MKELTEYIEKDIKFSDLKFVLNFTSKNNIVFNVEFKYDGSQVPLFIDKFPDESSIYFILDYLLNNKNFVSEFIKNKFNINLIEFSSLHEIEKAFIILNVLCLDQYYFNVNNISKSKLYLENVIGKSNVLDVFFDECYDQKSSITINLIPEIFNNINTDYSICTSFNLDTFELSIGDLFIHTQGDIKQDVLLCYNMFLYHFKNMSEVQNMEAEEIAGTLTEGEYYHFADIMEDSDLDIVNIDNSNELLEWICNNDKINVFKYKNKMLTHKFPIYMMWYSNLTNIRKDEIINHILFDKTKCPEITLSLKDCFNNSNNE